MKKQNINKWFLCSISLLTFSLYGEFTPLMMLEKEYPILDGQALTVIDLYNIKNNPEKLLHDWKQELLKLTKTSSFSSSAIENLQERIDRLEKIVTYIEPFIFWWQKIPTIGLRLEEPFWPIHYPYLPHAFALWELAPHMGKDVEVFLVDTGIASFSFNNNQFYKKHQDLEMMADFSKEKYNFINDSKDILDPFEQLIEMITEYTNDSEENENRIRKMLPVWIKNYLRNNDETDIFNYLLKYGKDHLLEDKKGHKILTEEGKRALREILYGQKGLRPKHSTKFNYKLVDLEAPHYQKDVLLEFLPTAPILQNTLQAIKDEKEDTYFSASYESGHGSHSAGIIGGKLHYNKPENNQFLTPLKIREFLYNDSGMCGIAPHCNLMMIKALRSDGEVNDRSTVIRGIKHAYDLNAQILNLSLKIDDQLDTTAADIIELENILAKIPYVIASSGNAVQKKFGIYQSGIEGYPAKFACVPFDVGAFSFFKDKNGNYQCPIADISQYQENVGPKFVMPGHNILSCGLVPNQKEDSMYVFMQGTSAAAPMISGALALILGEFKDTFKNERQLFLKVCYTSGIYMQNTDDWKQKTLLGTLDLRTALFTLHVLKKIQTNILSNKYLKKNYPFNNYENHYIKAIHMILMSMINDFIKKHSIKESFKNNFIGFFNNTIKNRNETKKLVQNKLFKSLDYALNYVTNIIIATLTKNESLLPKEYNNELLKKELGLLFTHSTVDLFAECSDATKKRIALLL